MTRYGFGSDSCISLIKYFSHTAATVCVPWPCVAAGRRARRFHAGRFRAKIFMYAMRSFAKPGSPPLKRFRRGRPDRGR